LPVCPDPSLRNLEKEFDSLLGRMARSTYVYVILNHDIPVAGFTVKHEMMTWLERHQGRFVIYRLSDGDHRPVVDITEELFK
jgi:hypothetical protein